MGREVRRVNPEWKHPDNKPLFGEPFLVAWTRWEIARRHWDRGEIEDWFGGGGWKPKNGAALECESFCEWDGDEPDPADYMPPESRGEWFQMYETCTEGTPISPPFATPEELARWLADNNASAFGRMTATYEQWLAVARGGWAPSLVADDSGLRSGVAAI